MAPKSLTNFYRKTKRKSFGSQPVPGNQNEVSLGPSLLSLPDELVEMVLMHYYSSLKAGICLASIKSLAQPAKFPAERSRVTSRKHTCLNLLLTSKRLYGIALPAFLKWTNFRFVWLSSAYSGFSAKLLDENDAMLVNQFWPNLNLLQRISVTRRGSMFLADNKLFDSIFADLKHIECDTLTASCDTYPRSEQRPCMLAVTSFMRRGISVRTRFWFVDDSQRMHGPLILYFNNNLCTIGASSQMPSWLSCASLRRYLRYLMNEDLNAGLGLRVVRSVD